MLVFNVGRNKATINAMGVLVSSVYLTGIRYLCKVLSHSPMLYLLLSVATIGELQHNGALLGWSSLRPTAIHNLF